MTEQEWRVCGDPIRLLGFYSSRLADRKARLFVLNACRMCPTLPAHDELGRALDCAERLIDGPVGEEELAEARRSIEWGTREPWESLNLLSEAVGLLFQSRPLDHLAAELVVHGLGTVRRLSLIREDEGHPEQSELLRELVPFRPMTCDPSWLTPTVTALARGMYDSRDFAAMPILADALQDAGCENADILDHCRGPGPHVRGCWVVDLVLGKE